MAIRIRRADYFYATVRDRPGEAFRLLSRLAEGRLNLLAFGAVPIGPDSAQLTIFPDDVGRLEALAREAKLELDGPHPAILVHGDDRLGALAEIHERLYESGVNVFASSGVTDGKQCFGYVLYVKPTNIDEALRALRPLGA